MLVHTACHALSVRAVVAADGRATPPLGYIPRVEVLYELRVASGRSFRPLVRGARAWNSGLCTFVELAACGVCGSPNRRRAASSHTAEE